MLSAKAITTLSALAISGIIIGSVAWEGQEDLTKTKSVMNEMYDKIMTQEKSIDNLIKGIEVIKETANGEIQKLEIKLDEEENENLQLSEENRTLSRANNELDKENQKLEKDNEKLVSDNEQLNQNKGELEDENKSLIEYVGELEKDLLKANKQAEDLGDFAEKMEEDLEGVGEEVIKPDTSLK